MYRVPKKPKPIEIDKFLGINTSIGETEIKIGEAVYMRNFRVTKNYKAQKRPGHNTFTDYTTGKVYGGWHGELGGKDILITCNQGKVYEYDFVLETNTQIGTITDAPTTIIFFFDKVYFFNGTDYKEYDGTTYQDVASYVPTLTIGAAPDGTGSTLFEEINLLTGAKWQEYVGDATATYTLAEQNIDADSVQCTVEGVVKTETSDFTVNRTLGTVLFSVAPTSGQVVRLRYVKANASNVALVKSNRFATKFGVSNDTSLFIWGNVNNKNVYYVSGSENASYFPANEFYKVSSNDHAITDLQPQYDRLLIFKEDRTHYSYAQSNPLYANNAGLNEYIYPAYDLNEAVGNIAFNGVQLIENDPVSINSKAAWRWTNTQVEDERNARVISDRVKELLLDSDLSNAITYDYQTQKELWINVDDIVYIYNYGNDTWYIYDNITANWFLEIGEYLYYGNDGTVERFDGNNDNNTAIYAIMELGYTDFDVNWLYKNTRKLWVTIQPDARTTMKVLWETDKKKLDSGDALEVEYYYLDFNDIDFNLISFNSSQAPQGQRLKIRAKKYQYIKFIFENAELNQTLTLLNFNVQAETTSEVK